MTRGDFERTKGREHFAQKCARPSERETERAFCPGSLDIYIFSEFAFGTRKKILANKKGYLLLQLLFFLERSTRCLVDKKRKVLICAPFSTFWPIVSQKKKFFKVKKQQSNYFEAPKLWNAELRHRNFFDWTESADPFSFFSYWLRSMEWFIFLIVCSSKLRQNNCFRSWRTF